MTYQKCLSICPSISSPTSLFSSCYFCYCYWVNRSVGVVYLLQVRHRVLECIAAFVCIHIGVGCLPYALYLVYRHHVVVRSFVCVCIVGGLHTCPLVGVRVTSTVIARSTPWCRGIGIPFVSVLRVVATYPVSEGAINAPALPSAQVVVRCYVPPCGQYVRPRIVPRRRLFACPELCARCGVVPCPHPTQGHLTLALHTHDLCRRFVLRTGSLFVSR